jgi:hypothetical protein
MYLDLRVVALKEIEQFRNLHKSSTSFWIVKPRRLQWAENVASME